MKHHFAIALLVIAPLCPLRAETPIASEFTRLQQQQQKAIQAAVEPLNRRYADTLQALLRRATAAGDLDTALKVRAELQGLGAASPGIPPASAPTTSAPPSTAGPTLADSTTLELRLVGTKWTFPMNDKPENIQWIAFKAKGALGIGWHPEGDRAWRVTGSDTVEVRPMGNQNAVYGIQFDPLLRSATLISGDRGRVQLERKK